MLKSRKNNLKTENIKIKQKKKRHGSRIFFRLVIGAMSNGGLCPEQFILSRCSPDAQCGLPLATHFLGKHLFLSFLWSRLFSVEVDVFGL